MSLGNDPAPAAASSAGRAWGDAGVDPFTQDILRMLWLYTAGAKEVLGPVGSAGTGVVRPPPEADLGEHRRGEELTVEKACVRHREALAEGHACWLGHRDEITQGYFELREQELRLVQHHYLDPDVLEVLRGHCAGRGEAALKALEATSREGPAAEDRRRALEHVWKDWDVDVREAVLMKLRQDWQATQRQALEYLSRELRAEHQAACDVMQRQAQASEQIAKGVQEGWVTELGRAQRHLDQLSQAFQIALKSAYEVELQEIRQHGCEQAAFFDREINEALRIEEEERRIGRAQLRRMRLALLKWRRDYLHDAHCKAGEAAKRLRCAVAPGGAAAAAAREGGARVQPATPPGAAPGTGMEQRPQREAEIERLCDMRFVLEKIWGRLPVAGDERRRFLLRLEEAVPCTGEIADIYDRHLAEHGVLAALGWGGSSAPEPDEVPGPDAA